MSLSFFLDAGLSSALPSDASKDFVKQAIEEKFNVELNVQYMAGGQDHVNKINTLIAANDAPDMWKDTSADGGLKLATQNVLADLTPFVTEASMPNYFKYWITPQELKYFQGIHPFMRAAVPYEKRAYRAYYIREDWLKNLGLEVPDTYEEYLQVLRAFRNNDPDGNGKKDTYGFTTTGDSGKQLGLDWPEYMKNGLVFASRVEDNKFVDTQTDLRMEGVINDIVKVNEEDLVDPDWFLNKIGQQTEKAAQGKAGVVLGTTMTFALDSNPTSLQSMTKQLFPEANWIAFNPLGDKPLQTMLSPGNPFVFSKKTAENNPEKIKRTVQILDWLASPEGFLLTHYGVEGKHYTREGNTITLKPEAYQADIVDQGNFLDVWDFFTPNNPTVFGFEVIDPTMSDRDRQILASIAQIPTLPGYGMTLTAPEGFDLASFRNKQKEWQVKLVFEDKSGSKWPEYREKLMTEYKGQLLFDTYESQLKQVGVIK
ncbi:type 2 periplasmic-binding domain-containing protein [Cohnella rhizosphaerae]|uniref:Extracellular solute-binding protein n=1 Tax=Cohnella rhizosphaerae TaxID=1457232 RepID=A0A9X4QTI5_9BACL|nr:extracellular solute-binding protein [Cohnella rhizosphaerae]MDG0810388.1 extracellular solute-binding protein [Cohnella rhizosphaerae]